MMRHNMERVKTFQKFNELRLAGKLCDVVLVADDVKFEAHRVVLCGCSSYFQALFTSDWNDSGNWEYQFPGIFPETLRQIIEYAYTYSVLVTADNVENLLVAADQLNILGIVQRCCDFLHDQLCPQNCIGIFKIADLYCLNELRQSAFHSILRNFQEVSTASEEFPKLTLTQLCDIIEKDELNVRQENVVFDAILRWIKHEPASREAHISVLLPKVRMARMDPEYFMKIVKNNDLVKTSAACRHIVNDVLKVMYDLDVESPCCDFDNPLIRPRLPSDIVLAVGGWNMRTNNWIDAYDTRADRWVDVTQEEQSYLAGHGTVYLDGFVYCIGGFDGQNFTNTVRRFNPVTRTWQEMAPMHWHRCNVSVVVLDGFIYAMGGHIGFRPLNKVERYDPVSNKWTLIEPMNEWRNNASATILSGKIYICGGHNGTESVSTAECYDPLTKQWTMIAPMNTPRHSLGVTAYHGKIYAVGGMNRPEHLQVMEAYDPSTNRWHAMAPMPTPRSEFGIAVVDDLLFVMGGNDGFRITNKVECFDPKTGSWYLAQDMSKPKKHFSCCVVPAHPNIIKYAAPR